MTSFMVLFLVTGIERVFSFENVDQLIGFLQPDDVDSNSFNQKDSRQRTSLCTRDCDTDPAPKLCYYQFTLEQYTVMGPACENCPRNISHCFQPQCVAADGFEKTILTANRRLPGPSIQVCQGDTVIVDVMNKMPGRGTALHWHGLKQRGTPYMDGMPGVTQCPILSDQTFRYKFRAANIGTFFWHSHEGTQKMDGLVGSLVVRARDDPNRDFYDFDLPSHVVLITDWMHETSDDHLPGLLRSNIGQEPDVYLVNGRGVYLPDFASMIKLSAQSDFTLLLNLPLTRFIVKRGLRYRVRIIGGSCLSCPFRIYFQNHRITLINMDMIRVEPVTVDSADISSGERFDFVINANQPVASYWIYVEGLGACRNKRGVAVLQYEGASFSKPLFPLPGITGIPNGGGVVFNRRNAVCTSNSNQEVCITQLISKKPNPPELVKEPPDARILVDFLFFQFNRTTLFGENDYKRYFAPISEIAISHPFHIHGYEFYIMETGVFSAGDRPAQVSALMERLESQSYTRNDYPSKDTIDVPASGYAVTRIIANNPGFWFVHCHFIYHLVSGMSLVIQVGELNEMPPIPRNFPTCGDFLTPDASLL